MHRGFCLIWIVALALCGCPKKEEPLETQTIEVQSAPAQPSESNEPNAPTESKHPVVTTAREFANTIAAGKYNRALALSIPGEITQQSLLGMHNAFQWDQATFTQIWVGAEQAAIVCSVPAQQVSATWTFALNLVAVPDGRWLVRLADQLRTPEEAEDYIAAFQEVAPGAQSIDP